jgi:hypothetical protein
MATMIPAEGPQEIGSEAEKSIYYLLKKQLPDEFTVIHSLMWLAKATTEINGGKAPTGEIDFLILHAELGVLVLEVKGGKYKVQGSRFVHIKNNFSISPVHQVRNNSHGLARWLGVDSNLRYKIGYGLIFPDSVFGDANISTALVDVTVEPPQKILIDRRDITNIGKRIFEIMSCWRDLLPQPILGQERLKKIIDAICPNFDGSPQWGSRVIYDNKIWLKLTPEQSSVVHVVSTRPRTLVTGLPGTGKTIIAIEAAMRRASAGEKLLFLTTNKLLSEYVKTHVNAHDSTSVFTWHSFCQKFSQSKLNGNQDSNEWFETGCLDDFKEAARQNFVTTYDTIIIDEAQTFRSDWIASLIQWHKGSVVAFCDATQVFSFEKDRVSVDELCDFLEVEKPYLLTIPLRSPRLILDKLLEIQPVEYQISSRRESELDSLQELLVEDMTDALTTTLSSLTNHGLKPSDIAVLSKHGWDESVKNQGYIFEKVSRFRGIEAPAIIVCDAQKMDDAELFSAYSRATSICIALYDAEVLGSKESGTKFHQSLLTVPKNDNLAREAFRRSKTEQIIDSQLRPKWLPLTSIKIAWSAEWGGWLIQRGELPVFTDLWMYFLLAQFSRPVYTWSPDAVRRVEYYLPNEQRHLNFYSPLDLLGCDKCQIFTPQNRITTNIRSCLFCSGLDIDSTSPTENQFNELSDLDKIVSLSPSARTTGQTKAMPLLLAAAALSKYAYNNAKRTGIIDSSASLRAGTYGAAVAFVRANITLLSEGKVIEAAKLARKTYDNYTIPHGLEFTEWKKYIDQALAASYNSQGLLTRVEKGVYLPATIKS